MWGGGGERLERRVLVLDIQVSLSQPVGDRIWSRSDVRWGQYCLSPWKVSWMRSLGEEYNVESHRSSEGCGVIPHPMELKYAGDVRWRSSRGEGRRRVEGMGGEGGGRSVVERGAERGRGWEGGDVEAERRGKKAVMRARAGGLVCPRGECRVLGRVGLGREGGCVPGACVEASVVWMMEDRCGIRCRR